jgi:hypothetical protein
MVKLNNSIKSDILEKIRNGSTTGSIIKEYGLSRSSVQRIKNELPLLSHDDNTSYASSSKEELNNLLNDLNDPIIEQPVKMTDQKTDMNHNNRIIEEETIRVQNPVQIDSTFHNIHGKMDIINKLDLFNESKVNQNQNQSFHQPQVQPKKIMINGIEDDYIKKRNLVNKCKLYIDEFPERLNNLHGGDPATFKHRLRELDCPQLEILIENIKFEISAPSTKILFNNAFFILMNQTESLSKSFLGYNINGLSEQLKKNNDVNDALRELSCQFDLSNYTTPEIRLGSAILLTAMSIYNTNKITESIDNYLEKPIEPNIQEQFKNL